MEMPWLIIVTGRPGAGKTTFSRAFAQQAFLPVVHRDALKEGYLVTMQKSHDQLPASVNRKITDLFFSVVGTLLEEGISLVAEGAFQHTVWEERLAPFFDRTRMVCLICDPGEETAKMRCLSRSYENPAHVYFHGAAAISPYQPPSLPVPTFLVDTKEDSAVDMKQLVQKVFSSQ